MWKQFALGLALALAGCGGAGKPSVDDARKFVEEAETKLLAASNEAGRASWIYSTFINQDTEAASALANERQIGLSVELAKAATKFDGMQLPEDLARKLRLLKLQLSLAAPSDPKKREELVKAALREWKENVHTLPLHRQVIPWAARSNVTVVPRADNWFEVQWVTIGK